MKKRPITEIQNENCISLMGEGEIVDQFVSFYKNQYLKRSGKCFCSLNIN